MFGPAWPQPASRGNVIAACGTQTDSLIESKFDSIQCTASDFDGSGAFPAVFLFVQSFHSPKKLTQTDGRNNPASLFLRLNL